MLAIVVPANIENHYSRRQCIAREYVESMLEMSGLEKTFGTLQICNEYQASLTRDV